MFVSSKFWNMKKNIAGILVIVLASTGCSHSVNMKEKQQVRVENVNGVQTVTITTVKDGIEKKEVFKGDAGEAKLKELEKEAGKLNPMIAEGSMKETRSRKVSMVDENGNKTLTIEEMRNGKTTKQTYTGDEAVKKMKEIEAQKSM